MLKFIQSLIPKYQKRNYRKLLELQNYVNKIEAKNARLERELESIKEIKPYRIPFEVGDPSPKDKEARKQYVASVAELHTDIIKPKLENMISTSYLLLEQTGSDRETDQALKGTIYAFREFIRWGNSMVNEQLANQIGDAPADPEINNEE